MNNDKQKNNRISWTKPEIITLQIQSGTEQLPPPSEIS